VAVALLADAHVGGPGGRGDDLAEQLAGLDAATCEMLLILGDLFHVWVGDTRYETEEIRRLLTVIDDVRSRGVVTRYVEGNRDFFLDDSVYARHFDSVGLEHAFVEGGVRYLAVHGDGIDDRDWRYRFWRRASKNSVSRAAARSLPGRLARRFVHGMDRRLAETNFEHKIRIPESVIRRYGEERLREGHDVVLLGHFHQPLTFAVAGGQVRVVDAWFNTRRLEWLR
jgi:UDP-2,3-diacylglucosamine pyrophosphatase LpxH